MAEASSADVRLVQYEGEHQLKGIIDLISVDLSEPYSIFTYRYFINQWPQLCYVALAPGEDLSSAEAVVGVIVCKQDVHRSGRTRGYIAMLAVHHSMRKRGMGSRLVSLAVRAMGSGGCDEAVLETEVTNIGALRLYEGLGFVRDKRLHKYYLNGNDAFRLKVWFSSPSEAGEVGIAAVPEGGTGQGEAGTSAVHGGGAEEADSATGRADKADGAVVPEGGHRAGEVDAAAREATAEEVPHGAAIPERGRGAEEVSEAQPELTPP